MEKDRIEELIKEYTLLYERANTKSKRKRLAEDLLSISDLYYNYLGEDKLLLWDKEGLIDDLIFENLYLFFDNIINRKNSYFNISNKVLNDFKNSGYNFNKQYYEEFKYFNYVSRKDFFEIISEFLNSLDSSLLIDFDKLINNKEALFLNSLYNESAFAYSLNNVKSSLLIFNDYFYDKFSIEFAAILLHEFGHRMEFSLYNDRTCCIDRKETPLIEISSTFLEYSFINYLIDNNIYKDDAFKYLNRMTRNLFCYSVDMNVFSKMEIDTDRLEESCDLEEFNDKRKDIFNSYNYFYTGDNSGHDIRNAFIYGLGTIASIYMYDFYKNNPKDFMKTYKNCLLNYPYSKSFDSFKDVGVSEDIILNGNLVKKLIKKN